MKGEAPGEPTVSFHSGPLTGGALRGLETQGAKEATAVSPLRIPQSRVTGQVWVADDVDLEFEKALLVCRPRGRSLTPLGGEQLGS